MGIKYLVQQLAPADDLVVGIIISANSAKTSCSKEERNLVFSFSGSVKLQIKPNCS
jgi:hypothetical protein